MINTPMTCLTLKDTVKRLMVGRKTTKKYTELLEFVKIPYTSFPSMTFPQVMMCAPMTCLTLNRLQKSDGRT